MSSPYRVLLVEDDPDFARLVLANLGPPDHDVVTLATARTARTRLSEQRFDLAIIDGVLPDGLGTDLIAWLRAAGDRTPIVFVSAKLADAATSQHLRATLGVHAVLAKPVELVALADAVRSARSALAPSRATDPPRVDPKVADALAALRRGFGRQLPARARELATALERARESAGPDAEALMLAHRLAGTAGSYGWMTISEWARRIEEELGRNRAARDWSLLATLSDRIEAAAATDEP